MALPAIWFSAFFFMFWFKLIFGDVFNKLALFEPVEGIPFFNILSLTIFPAPLLDDALEGGFPWLLAIDWDLLLGESTLPAYSLFDISLILAFFFDWSI